MELAVAGDVDLAEAAAVVEPDDLEPALGVFSWRLAQPVEVFDPSGSVSAAASGPTDIRLH